MNEELRLQYRQWLLRGDLDEKVTDAILETMPPYDWHNIARKEDIDRLDGRIDGLATDVRTINAVLQAQTTDIAALTTNVTALTTKVTAHTTNVTALTTKVTALTTNVTALTTKVDAQTTSLGELTKQVTSLDTNVQADRQVLSFLAEGNQRSIDQHIAVMAAVNGLNRQFTNAALTVIIAIAGMVSAGVLATVQLTASG